MYAHCTVDTMYVQGTQLTTHYTVVFAVLANMEVCILPIYVAA